MNHLNILVYLRVNNNLLNRVFFLAHFHPGRGMVSGMYMIMHDKNPPFNSCMKKSTFKKNAILKRLALRVE